MVNTFSDRDRIRAEQREQERGERMGYPLRPIAGVPGAVRLPSGSVYRNDGGTLRRYVPKLRGGKKARRAARAAARAAAAQEPAS